VDWQQRNLLRFQARFSEADVDEIADALKAALKVADKDALKCLAYVIGPVPKEVTVLGDETAPLRIVIEDM